MSQPDDIRLSYDTVAVDYERQLRDELLGRPIERALLTAFVESVIGPGQVLDAGCGPGRVSAYLQRQGLDVIGVDLSPGMVQVARAAHPGIAFDEGALDDLDLADNSLAGLVAWYSIIHTPDAGLSAIFREFHRVLAPGAPILLAFQSGDHVVHLEHAYGHPLALDVHHRRPEVVARLLVTAGFELRVTMTKEPESMERAPRGYLMMTKTASSS